ncbi:MAG: hypothetical protein ACAI43_01785 [Phycisphaerae bacterium]|nr:hypothetical protein [Tepidisphaeraceae bacterium]
MVHTQHGAQPQGQMRDIPIWLTIPIVLLCLGGGAYLVYGMFTANDKPGKQELSAEEAKARGVQSGAVRGVRPGTGGAGGSRWTGGTSGGTRGPAPAKDGIVENQRRGGGMSNYTVTAGTALLQIADGRPAQITQMSYPSFLTQDQAMYLFDRRKAIDDAAARTRANVTAEQVQKLNDMPAPETMKATADEKKDLLAKFDLWKNAAKDKKADAEKALVAAFDKVAKGRFEETKAYALARIDMVKTILTPEQIQLIRTPATPAAPKPAVATPAAPAPAAGAPSLAAPK